MAIALLAASLSYPGAATDSTVLTLKTVGLRHAEYAKAFVAEGLRLDSEELVWLRDVDDDCEWSGPDASVLSEKQTQQLQLFVNLFCQPWADWWANTLDQCDGENPPRWCREGAGKLSLDDYFAALVSALDRATQTMERYNLMFIMVNTLEAHVLTEFPERELERWYLKAAKAFLRTAEPDDAIHIAHRFQETWLGLFPSVADQIESYIAARPDLSAAQLQELKSIVEHRFSEVE